ncbi:MAG: hypothetical protein KDC85_23025 [Saprospiraceae bacterium]|nr:hypothetical protein [Saprospiraceae bacterium]MCB9325529.1 hypothetical protein [Lewinellaceae bacterium]
MRLDKKFPAIYCLVFCISGTLLFSACDDSKNRTQIKLSYQERRAIDTLYKVKVLELSPILDSLCDARFEKSVQESIDSILSERRAEEERLRRKIPIQR